MRLRVLSACWIVWLSMEMCCWAADRKPNVLILLADDSGWGDYGINGNRQARTPQIDALARQGAMLDRFYVCPVCSPTRAELLTGRYHPRGGVRGVSTGQERLNLDERTLADCFKAAGYATGAFGKWHNGSQWPYHPLARGFDEYFGFTSGHWGEYFDAPLEHNGQPVRSKGFIADSFVDRAIDFIERHQARPFLCYVPFNTPHSPFCVPDEYWAHFKDADIKQRGSDGERETLEVTRCALAMMENLDKNVGRVLQRLDDLKLAQDTIVVYFSDNGPNSFRWNGEMKGRKGSTDEGGVRSLCCVRWPGHVPAETTVREIAGAIDLLPTLTSLAGIERVGTKPLDGRNLTPLLTRQAVDWPDRFLFSTFGNQLSVRSQQYRLDAKGELFDMLADPSQTKDIAAEQPGVAQKMKAAATNWRREVFGPEAAAAEPLKPADRQKRLATKDDRPFPVGYRQFPRTPLPARDAVAHGNIKRSAPAPNCSYFVNWKSLDDAITWDIEVQTAGEYDVEILYACPLADAGATVELSFQSARLTGKVEPGWEPPLITNQDTITRPAAESIMKEFRSLKLGAVTLPTGRGELRLRALKIPGQSVMEVRQLNLTLR